MRLSVGPVVFVSDLSAHSGKETINGPGASAVAISANNRVYMKANYFMLFYIMQIPRGVAQQIAGKWVVFSAGDPAYKQLGEALTLPLMVQQVTPAGSATTVGRMTVDGKDVIVLRGTPPGGLHGSLYISARGSPLPLEAVFGRSGETVTSIFTDWGKPVRVSAPEASIAASTVGL